VQTLGKFVVPKEAKTGAKLECSTLPLSYACEGSTFEGWLGNVYDVGVLALLDNGSVWGHKKEVLSAV